MDIDLNTCCEMGSVSSQHYKAVLNSTEEYTYGRHSSQMDLVTMRLRLGYKYYWEVYRGAESEPCTLCARPGGHSLQHYVLFCPVIDESRPQGQWNLIELICYFIDNDILSKILKKHPMFAFRW